MELLLLSGFWYVLGAVAAVMLFFLPFFVFKIRNQVVDLNEKMALSNHYLWTLISITREANKDKLPSPKECPSCHASILWPHNKCSRCGKGETSSP